MSSRNSTTSRSSSTRPIVDHGPGGEKLERRAIQLGLRGATLAKFAREWIVGIADISAFVAEQRARRNDREELLTPREDVLSVGDSAVAARLGLATWP
ncbi:DUF4291 family protein [Nannocystaceae bacterium ST9]